MILIGWLLCVYQDEEIDKQSQLIEKMEQQMLEQEELIAQARRDNENIQSDMARISQVLCRFCL